MSSCAACGTTILFGGVRDDQGRRFCSDNCAYAFEANQIQLPEELVEQTLHEIHQGQCPHCGGQGPVDVHFSYRVMSFIVLTQFQTIPIVSCGRCATGAKIKNFLITSLIGWWGFPFGIIMTPIYLIRNVAALVSPVSPMHPSDHLRDHVQNLLIHEIAAHQAMQAQQESMDQQIDQWNESIGK